MPRIFYGWWIVAAGFICLGINAGIGFYSFPVFIVDLTQHLSWGYGDTSIGISLTFIIGGLASPLVGRLLPKYGAKKMMLIGAVIMSLAFLLFSLMRSLWQFYAICCFLAVGLSCTGSLATSYIISDWFQRKRGTAMGVMMIGVGLGGLIFVPLTERLITQLQWQKTFVVYGVFSALVMIPTAGAIIKRRPVELGVLPDGDSAADNPPENPGFALPKFSSAPDASWTFRSAVKTPTFWVIAGAFILATFGQTPILIHQVAYFKDIGISAEKAAAALGMCAFLGIGGKLFFGAMADRYPTRYAMMLCFGLQFFGTLLLLKTPSLGSPFWFVIVWGFAMGGVITLEPLIVVECFGMKSFGVILGVLYVLTTFGGSSGAPLAGYIFDATGSYTSALILFAITYCLSAGLSLLAVPPRRAAEVLEDKITQKSFA